MKHLIIILSFNLIYSGIQSQNTLSATYLSGDIPTSYDTYDDSCNGPSSTLSVILPPGDNFNVAAVDVFYDMTALGAGRISHQRSFIRFQNLNIKEATEASGQSNTVGTLNYARTITIANGSYSGGTELIFEMLALRTVEVKPGCNTDANKIDSSTWKIIVHYSDEVSNPKVGVHNNMPSQATDVAGKLKLSDDNTAPEAGTIRWNENSNDFEGFNGNEWLSFTKNEGGDWGSKDITENGSLIASSANEIDRIGFAVSVSGNIAVVGADEANYGSNNSQGKAYIYMKEGENWVSPSFIYLKSSDGEAGDKFGSSVFISGEYAIIGAPFKDIVANSNQGKAYIFNFTGTSWMEQAALISSDGESSDNFGGAVCISGNYAIIGAPLKSIGTNNRQGRAYIFKHIGSSWIEQDILTAPDGDAFDEFGSSVSISSDYAIVAASRKNVGANTDQGKAYIYKRSGTEWFLQSELLASDPVANMYFGHSVSLSGQYATVGAPRAFVGNIMQGKGYVYKRIGNSWLEQAQIIASDGSSGDLLGYSVSISEDYLGICAPIKNTTQGKAYIF